MMQPQRYRTHSGIAKKNPQGNQLVALGIFKVDSSNTEPPCVSSRSHRVAKRIFKCVYRKRIVPFTCLHLYYVRKRINGDIFLSKIQDKLVLKLQPYSASIYKEKLPVSLPSIAKANSVPLLMAAK